MDFCIQQWIKFWENCWQGSCRVQERLRVQMSKLLGSFHKLSGSFHKQLMSFPQKFSKNYIEKFKTRKTSSGALQAPRNLHKLTINFTHLSLLSSWIYDFVTSSYLRFRHLSCSSWWHSLNRTETTTGSPVILVRKFCFQFPQEIWFDGSAERFDWFYLGGPSAFGGSFQSASLTRDNRQNRGNQG